MREIGQLISEGEFIENLKKPLPRAKNPDVSVTATLSSEESQGSNAVPEVEGGKVAEIFPQGKTDHEEQLVEKAQHEEVKEGTAPSVQKTGK